MCVFYEVVYSFSIESDPIDCYCLEGRFRSCLAQDERYMLGCYRYIELNPVRANIVEHPAEYRWSSYRSNAQGEKTDALIPHSLYTGLGVGLIARQVAYRRFFRS
jgi:putative transposase